VATEEITRYRYPVHGWAQKRGHWAPLFCPPLYVSHMPLGSNCASRRTKRAPPLHRILQEYLELLATIRHQLFDMFLTADLWRSSSVEFKWSHFTPTPPLRAPSLN
jgi:hypothetical protein